MKDYSDDDFTSNEVSTVKGFIFILIFQIIIILILYLLGFDLFKNIIINPFNL